MVTRRDYTAEGVEAARSVLVELVHLLGEYKDDIVLIGGWVPEVLLPHYTGPHVGSLDVDIALNHQKIRLYCPVPCDEGHGHGRPDKGEGRLGHLLLRDELSWRDRFTGRGVQASPASWTGQRGLQKIAGKFSSEKAFGPKSIADFEEIEDPEEQERIQRDAYERVNALLKKLGIPV